MGVLLLALWERSQWTKESDQQCDAAKPLTEAKAGKDVLVRHLGPPLNEYLRTDWPPLDRHFGSEQNGMKLRDIDQWLQPHGSLLISSSSNSILFIYLDSDANAFRASCFLQ